MSLEEVAEAVGLPLKAVRETMRFYEAHRLEMNAAIEADRQFANEAGYDD